MLNSAILLALVGAVAPQDAAARFRTDADAKSNAGQHREAVLLIKEAIKLAPTNDQYWALASHFQRLDHQFAEGLKSAKEAIRLNNKVGWYFASAAFNAHEQFDIPTAIEYAKKTVAFGVAGVGEGNYESAKGILTDTISTAATPQEEWKTTQKEIASINREFGVTISYVDGSGPIKLPAFEVAPVNKVAVRLSLVHLRKALSVLPRGAVRQIGLNICLSSTITAGGNPTGGAADFGSRLIGLNVQSYHHERDIRGMIYHEGLHILDGFATAMPIEADWQALNAPGFVYVGYASPLPGEPPPGFVTPYSTVKAQEDRADLFCQLLLEPVKILGIAKKDPIVARKLAYLKKYLATVHGGFNSEFWRKAESGAFRAGS